MATEASSSVVRIDGCTFGPTVTRVPAGTEVTFLNTSTSPYDVTGRMGEWGSETLDVGQRYAHQFATAGVYAYSCSLHPRMAGVVVAGSPDMTLVRDVLPATTEPATTADGGSSRYRRSPRAASGCSSASSRWPVCAAAPATRPDPRPSPRTHGKLC